VAIVAVVLLEDPLAGDDLVAELVGMRQSRHLPLRINRQGKEDDCGDGRPEDKEPFGVRKGRQTVLPS
jgi:hypothetical protein